MPCGYRVYGAAIATLQIGDEVSIRAGAGFPQQKTDTTDIIIDVDGMSAVTARGIRLACVDGRLVRRTGNHFEPGTYEVTPEAQTVIEQDRTAAEQRIQEEA